MYGIECIPVYNARQAPGQKPGELLEFRCTVGKAVDLKIQDTFPGHFHFRH